MLNGIGYVLVEEWRTPDQPPDAINFNKIILYASAIKNMLHTHPNSLFLIPGNNTPLCFPSKIIFKFSLNLVRLEDYIWRKF